ncbi:hypothetical protein [Streptomyces sp. Y7]|uniref:hypothetical protein n=1 Tax=Streptomyces sp. Y7 TaxID=3342392 RepID=UPI0037135D8D
MVHIMPLSVISNVVRNSDRDGVQKIEAGHVRVNAFVGPHVGPSRTAREPACRALREQLLAQKEPRNRRAT